jgi:hypothetical protein
MARQKRMNPGTTRSESSFPSSTNTGDLPKKHSDSDETGSFVQSNLNTEEQEFYEHYLMSKEPLGNIVGRSLLILLLELMGTALVTLIFSISTIRIDPFGFALGFFVMNIMSV